MAASSNSRTIGSFPMNGGATPPAATIWQRFASLLGIEERHAEDALHSERAAKHVLSRRSFFGVSAAMAGAATFSIPTPTEAAMKLLPPGYFERPRYQSMATGIAWIPNLYVASGLDWWPQTGGR